MKLCKGLCISWNLHVSSMGKAALTPEPLATHTADNQPTDRLQTLFNERYVFSQSLSSIFRNASASLLLLQNWYEDPVVPSHLPTHCFHFNPKIKFTRVHHIVSTENTPSLISLISIPPPTLTSPHQTRISTNHTTQEPPKPSSEVQSYLIALRLLP